MILNQANLVILYQAFKTSFNQGFDTYHLGKHLSRHA